MEEINGKMKLTEEEISGYIDEANDILKNAYVPYSKFPVAALLIDEQGRKFRGVNVEIWSINELLPYSFGPDDL